MFGTLTTSSVHYIYRVDKGLSDEALNAPSKDLFYVNVNNMHKTGHDKRKYGCHGFKKIMHTHDKGQSYMYAVVTCTILNCMPLYQNLLLKLFAL